MGTISKTTDMFVNLGCIDKLLLENVSEKQHLLFEYIQTEGDAYVYNNIKSSSIKDVEKTGYSEEFYATNGGCMYTLGAYTNYLIGQTINATNSGRYGDTIVKYKVKDGFRDFLFFMNRSKSDFDIPPLDKQIAKWPELYNRLGKDYVNSLQRRCDNSRNSSMVAYDMLCRLGGKRERTTILSKLGIRGIIFYGGTDGPVAIIHNADDLIPVGYVTRPYDGYIRGHKDSDIKWVPLHYEYNDGSEVNAISYFMSQFNNIYDFSKTTRSYQGEILVRDKATKKYVYLDIKKKGPLFDDIQFEDAETFEPSGKARVKIDADSDWMYVDKEGNLYDDKNDKEPISNIQMWQMGGDNDWSDEDLDDLF